MRPAPAPRALTEREQQLEAAQAAAHTEDLGQDPWGVDAAVRARHPAWPFPAAATHEEKPQAPLQLLEPNWDAVKPRIAVSVPQFVHFITNRWAV